MCMWYVYVDWTTDSDPYPFYVGQGNLRRVGKKHRNTFHSNIAQLHGFRREIVFKTDIREEALGEEVRLIAELKTFHGDNPKGANFTKGGDGGVGRAVVLTDEWRAKISESLRGRKSDPEVNERRRESMTGKKIQRRPFTDEEKETLYASRRGRDLVSPEGRASQKEKLTGRKRPPFSEETKSKMREAALRREEKKRNENQD